MAVQIIDEFLPGTFGDTCLLCKASRRPDERIVDLGIYLMGGPDEGTGWLAICEMCANEIAYLVGCMPTRQGEILLQRNRELQARIETLETNTDKLRALVTR